MRKIGTKEDCRKLGGLPPPVRVHIEETIETLNSYYEENRNIDKNLGGYVLLIENREDLGQMKDIFKADAENLVAEFTDIISCETGANYTSSLILLSSDFSIILIIPQALTPKNLLERGRD